MSIRRSLSLMSTSTSSASGSTMTVAEDVWTRPCDSVTGTRWTRWVPASCFMRVQTASPLSSARDLGEPAEVGRRRAQQLEPPALALGVGLVHLEEVAGEEVGLLAAGRAPDLDDHVAVGVGVAGQQQQPQLLLARRDLRLERGDLGPHLVAVGCPRRRRASRWRPRGRRWRSRSRRPTPHDLLELLEPSTEVGQL